MNDRIRRIALAATAAIAALLRLAVGTVLNRNVVGAANGLRMRLSAVCARPA
jgi:hypothetical protein